MGRMSKKTYEIDSILYIEIRGVVKSYTSLSFWTRNQINNKRTASE